MRDPAVLAVFALRITAAEHERVAAGWRILRLFWPFMACCGVVVGLHVDGHVIGEARQRVCVVVRAGHPVLGSPASSGAPWHVLADACGTSWNTHRGA